MFCPNCGKEVLNDDVFCMYCGYRLRAPETAETKSEPEPAIEEKEVVAPIEAEAPVEEPAAENVFEFSNQAEQKKEVFTQAEEELKVPIKEMSGNGPSKICLMCGCKIPADSVYCPVCQQYTGYASRQQAQPQPQAQPYYAPYAQQKPRRKQNVLAIIGFILSLVGFLSGEVYLGIVLSIAGLVLGAIGLKKVKELGKGKAFAIVAIVVGAVGIVLNVVLIVLTLTGVIDSLYAYLEAILNGGTGVDGDVTYPFGDGFFTELY